MTSPRPRRPGEQRPSWRERLAAFRYVPALLRLVWETHRGYAATMVVLRLAGAFVPVTTLWIGKLIIDEVVHQVALRPHLELSRLWQLVAFELAATVGGDLLARGSAVVESLLGDRFTNHISVRLMEHAAALDLQFFEEPEFYDRLERARQSTTGRVALLTNLLGMAQHFVTIVSLGAALVVFNAWLLALLVVAVVPTFLGETHFAGVMYAFMYRWTSQRRELDYLRYVGASAATAKEVQLFGLAPWVIERYRRLSDRFYDENRRLALRRNATITGLTLLGTAGYYGAVVVVLLEAVHGAITLGSLTFLTASFQRARGSISTLLSSVSQIGEQALYLRDLFAFFEVKPTIVSRPDAPRVPRPLRRGFVFEDVGFRYPGSDRWAVRHLSFALGAGERVALVGENGAGKTTLTKLIARLYDPTEGRILLDGLDLREYDLADLRRTIGVIFQDFVRYDMRLEENIGVGEIEDVREYLERSRLSALGFQPGDAASLAEPPAIITESAEKSLAISLLPRLTGGYRQMLGRRFEGGVELSGGEWQKVALGRAYMRDAQILILDEPTAALDARAEYEVFVRFSELIAGRAAVLISHRFSTVRMADRIVVMQQGEIVESGTHDQLVARNGLYAELFNMQAAGYR